MSMIHRIPSSESVGLKDDFNGPICYTPDGNPLVGPAPGLRNLWLAEGFSFGITAAGRHRALPGADDGRGRGRDRHGRARPPPLRRVDDDRVRRAQERGMLFARLRPAPPGRGARGLPAAQDGALLRPGEGAGRAVRAGERLGAAELLRAAGLRRPRRAQLPPRRLVALCCRGGAGDPRERRHDRRLGLHQARGEGAGRHRLPRLVHHQPAAEGRAAEPDLRPDRGGNDPHRVHDRRAGRGRLLPRLGRRLDRLRRGLSPQGRRGPRRRLRHRRDPGRDLAVGRLRPRRPGEPGAPRQAAVATPSRGRHSGTGGSRGCRRGGSSS